MHHITKLSQTQILYLFYFQVSSTSHLHYSVSTSICIHLFMLLSTFVYTSIFLVTIYLFLFLSIGFHILLYLVPDPFRFLSFIFISIFVSDFVPHFHQYSVCLITPYVDTTIYSSVLIIDLAFRLLTSLCYLTSWVCTHLVSHWPLVCLAHLLCIHTFSQI